VLLSQQKESREEKRKSSKIKEARRKQTNAKVKYPKCWFLFFIETFKNQVYIFGYRDADIMRQKQKEADERKKQMTGAK
jgi:hypothetical protein